MPYVDRKIDLIVATVEDWREPEGIDLMGDWTLDEIFRDVVHLGAVILADPEKPKFRERAGKILRILPIFRPLIPAWQGRGDEYRLTLVDLESKLLDAVEHFDQRR